MSELTDMMGLTEDESMLVLRYFKWNMDKLSNEWFVKEKSLRLQIGLEFDRNIPIKHSYVNSSLAQNNQGYCYICYGELS